MNIENVIKINNTVCLLSSNGRYIYNCKTGKQACLHMKTKKIVFNSALNGKFVSVKVKI